MHTKGSKLRLWLSAAAITATVIGCSAEEAENDLGDIEARRAALVDPQSYAGDLTMLFPATLPTRLGPLPFDVYAGLSSESETRLGVRAFADLRGVQARLPELLTGDIEQSCNQDITLDTSDVEADGDRVIVRGQVLARIYSCRRRDTPEERRGIRLISQRVDAIAIAGATVRDDCIEFTLDDLQLDPSGLIGGLANLLGVTDRVRTAILQGAEDLLEENPVCPELPPELQSLAPKYTSGGTREVGGGGGMGAALSGSVDASASTLMELLALAQERRVVEGQR